VKLAAALVAVICVAVTSAPAMAVAPPVLPSLLVARTHDLRGFGSAKVSFYWTASAVEWAHGRGQSEAEAKSETAGLLAQGFQEGAEAVFTGRRERGGKRREAVSDGYVFATVAGAEHFLRALVAESLNAYPKRGLEHFAVPSIPGAVGAGDFVSGRRGVTGKCVLRERPLPLCRWQRDPRLDDQGRRKACPDSGGRGNLRTHQTGMRLRASHGRAPRG
jgi:hypothetical protein